MENNKILTQLACDYAKYLDHNVDEKIKPINDSLNNMLARLEEFETMFTFLHQDINSSIEAFNTISTFQDQFNLLCSKIDSVEKLVNHIKCNLESLEQSIEKHEQKYNIAGPKGVANIFAPFFKLTVDNRAKTNNTPLFKPEDYFDDTI